LAKGTPAKVKQAIKEAKPLGRSFIKPVILVPHLRVLESPRLNLKKFGKFPRTTCK